VPETRRKNLTDAVIRSLSPEPGKKYLVYDKRAPGLHVAVLATGKRVFYFRYSRRRRPRYYRIGPTDVLKVDDARAVALGLARRLLLEPGFDPAAERKANRGAVTFAELCTRYVEEYARKKNKSWKHSAGLIENHAIPVIGDLAAAEITKPDVKRLLAKYDETPSMKEHVRLAISAVFTWAIKEEMLKVNPCSGVEGHKAKSRERVLSDKEIRTLWSAADQFGLVVSTALKVILLTGQRPGEVAHMRRDHIKDGWWEMPGEFVKNKHSHRVWLTEKVRELLAELDDEQGSTKPGCVFANSRGSPVRGLDEAMRKLSERCFKDDPVRPHDLRRTFGTTVTKLKHGRAAMNRILNHRSGDAVGDIYDRHDYADDDKRIMEAVTGHLLRLAEGVSGNVVSFGDSSN